MKIIISRDNTHEYNPSGLFNYDSELFDKLQKEIWTNNKLGVTQAEIKHLAFIKNIRLSGELNRITLMQYSRLTKDYKKADELKDKLVSLGWEINITKKGVKVTYEGKSRYKCGCCMDSGFRPITFWSETPEVDLDND